VNIYRIIILSSLLIRYFLDLISQYLTIRSSGFQVPEEVRDVYDEEKYYKSQEYNRTRARFHIVEATFNLGVLLIFWFSGGFSWLDEIVRSWGFNSIITGIVYIGILMLANTILVIPFQIYSTFVIEERFGFNRTTPKTFITDQIKKIFLMIVLGMPLLAVILWFFETMGPNAWLYCWIISMAFILLIQFIAPIWIMPLFNKFTPLPEGELRRAIEDYAKSVNFSFRDIYVVDASKRSTKANAFFTGFGKNKRIALFDTLVADNDVPAVVAVLAHEIGHYKMKHVQKQILLAFLQMGILFGLLSFFINNPKLFEAFYMRYVSVYAGLLFFGLLYEPISLVLSVIMNYFSRKNELEADRYAVLTTNAKEPLIIALKNLYNKNLANLTPHPMNVALTYSHPPLLKRIREIRSTK
jgi:STE24 endopeptidase